MIRYKDEKNILLALMYFFRSVPLRMDSESVAKQIPMMDKCVCITSIIHYGKLALIMFQNVGRYIGINMYICISIN